MKKATGIFVSVLMTLVLLLAACATQPTATPQPTSTASPPPTQAASPVAQASPSPTATAAPSPTRTPTPAPTETRSTEATATPATTRTTAPAVTPTPGPAPAETLGDILSRGTGLASVNYDVVMTSPGQPSMTQKMWLKKNRMRMESTTEGQTVVNFIDTSAKTMLTYMPSQNTAIKMDFSQAPQPATDTAKSVMDYKPTVVGSEVLDGKDCLIVEYTNKDVTARMWIWKQYGLPIRSEMTSAHGKVVLEYKNISFNDIPDSTFELPTGVQVMSMPTIPGMPPIPTPPK